MSVLLRVNPATAVERRAGTGCARLGRREFRRFEESLDRELPAQAPD